MGIFSYITNNFSEIMFYSVEHLKITLLSVLMAILIGFPIGVFISYAKKFSKPILAVSNVIQAIPSLALLGFLIPLLGIGTLPSIVMVVLYSLLPIIKNTEAGLSNVDGDLIQAAKGIGLTNFQILYKVKLPMALPVIMAGIRISTVTAVGLVTMAAFIGGGGLGYLVYAGISSVNNAQIVAGALPACILALSMDFLGSQIEGAVTPISFRYDIHDLNIGELKVEKRKQKRKIYIMLTTLVLIISMGIFSILKPETEKIVVGSKDYTEQHILGHMLSDIIEDKTNFKVDRKINLGGSQVLLTAAKSKEVDVYVEYTGTIYSSVMKEEDKRPADEVFSMVGEELKENYGLIVMEPLGFNNTYAIAVNKDIAEKNNLESISDLKSVSKDLIISPTIEITNRLDGLDGLIETYALDFNKIIPMNGSPRYLALENGESQVTDAFSTDGLLQEYDLKVLEDDLNYFPTYDAFPLIGEDVINDHPEIKEAIEVLVGEIDADTMRSLNYKVDVLGENPRNVANEFLKEEGYIN